MRILAFTGLPGSGKSEAIAVARQLGVPVVRMGDFVLAEVRRRGLPETEQEIGPVATGMRESEGEDIWARRTVKAIRDGAVPDIDEATSLVMVDGVRSPAEVDRFKRELGRDFVLVAIVASREARHRRILGRGRSDDADDAGLVAARDEREKGWGLEQAMRQADHQLENDGTLDELRERVAALLNRLAPQTS